MSRAPTFGDGKRRIVGKGFFFCTDVSNLASHLNHGRTNRRVLSPDGFPISVYQWHLKYKHSECLNFYLGEGYGVYFF